MHLSHIQIRQVISFVLRTDLISDNSVASVFQDFIVLFGLNLDKLDKLTDLITFVITRALESLKTEGRNSKLWETISLAEVIKTLEDLIEYFAPPGEDLGNVDFY